MLLDDPSVAGVDHHDARQSARCRGEPRADFDFAVAAGERAVVDAGRVDVDHSECREQPRGLDRHHLANGALAELVVPAEVNCRRLIAADPHPEQLIVAAEIDLLAGDACAGGEAEMVGPLGRDIRGQDRQIPSCPGS